MTRALVLISMVAALGCGDPASDNDDDMMGFMDLGAAGGGSAMGPVDPVTGQPGAGPAMGPTGTPPAGPGGSITPTAPPPVDPNAKRYSFTVSEFTVDESFISVPGANVCVGVRTEIPAPGDPQCGRSDDAGIAEFDMSDGRSAITVFKRLFTRAIVPFVVQDDYQTELDVPGAAVASAVAGMVMAPWPMNGMGMTTVTVRGEDGKKLAGAQVSLGPDEGLGGTYTDAILGFPNGLLTETTRTGMVIFMDVKPGLHQVTVTHPTLNCRPGEAWPSSTGDTAEIPIEPDSNTLASIICEAGEPVPPSALALMSTLSAGSPVSAAAEAVEPDAGAVMACLARGAEQGEDAACSECICNQCADESAAVFANEDAVAATEATSMIDCQRDSCCSGSECYCGEGVDAFACISGAKGPCKAQVEAAARVTGAAMIQLACDADTADSPCSAVSRLGRCSLGDDTVQGHCPMCNRCM